VLSHYIHKHYKRFQHEKRQIVNYKHEIKQAMTSERDNSFIQGENVQSTRQSRKTEHHI